MLNQYEIDFYIGNRENIIKRENNRHVTACLKYDAQQKTYAITRKTKNTLFEEREKDYEKAFKIYLAFLYLSAKELENRLLRFGSYIGGLYQ